MTSLRCHRPGVTPWKLVASLVGLWAACQAEVVRPPHAGGAAPSPQLASLSASEELTRARLLVLAVESACAPLDDLETVADRATRLGLPEPTFETQLAEAMEDPGFSAAVAAGRSACPERRSQRFAEPAIDVPTPSPEPQAIVAIAAAPAVDVEAAERESRDRLIALLASIACAPDEIRKDLKRLQGLIVSQGFNGEQWIADATRFKGDPEFTAELVRRTEACAQKRVPQDPPPASSIPSGVPVVAPVAPAAPVVDDLPVALPAGVEPRVPNLFEPIEPRPPAVGEAVPPPPGCQSDVDCKGDRICDRERCVDP